MKNPSNIIPFRAQMTTQHQEPDTDLAAALERARPAILAACEPVKGLRAERRAQTLRALFAPMSTATT